MDDKTSGACLTAPGSHASHHAPSDHGPTGFDPSRDAMGVLQSLSSYVGAGLGDDTTTAFQYDRRIRWGIDHLRDVIVNTPETADFMAGVPLEAVHQRKRWGAEHDAGKGPLDWFWLIGYLAQKAADAAMRGDADKAKHHTISTAAALANWHAALTGADTSMRPGIEPPRDRDAGLAENAKRSNPEGAAARAEGIARPSSEQSS